MYKLLTDRPDWKVRLTINRLRFEHIHGLAAMSLRTFFGAIFGAVSDVFGKPLRGLALIAALVAILVLIVVAAVTAIYLVPLIPNLPGAPDWTVSLAKGAEGVGAIVLAAIATVLLWPPLSMLIGGGLFDVAAERVEKQRFSADAPGKPPSLGDGLAHALSTALPTLGLNLLALPFFLFPPLAILVFFLLNGHLMSRDFFTLAALRFRSRAEVKALRKKHSRALFFAGLTCAALLYFPLLNFLAPLYGAALMVRLNKAMEAA